MNFSDTNHKKTLSSFSISSTNIRSLCMMDKTKRMRKLLAIRNLDSDISIIIDSQMDERDESSLYKAHRMIMSEYKTVSNYKKPRGVTILIKKKTGITLGNIEVVDKLGLSLLAHALCSTCVSMNKELRVGQSLH